MIGENIINDLPRTYYGLLNVHIVTALMSRLSVVYDNSYLGQAEVRHGDCRIVDSGVVVVAVWGKRKGRAA